MASGSVALGGVAFRDFEIPEAIVFGGAQRMAVHQPVGGGRVIDVLGAEAETIRFSGTFSGPDAEARAQLLDIARVAGATLPLAWSGFAFSVVIGSFVAVYQKPWWIPFEIELVAVENLVTAAPTALAQAGLDLASAVEFGDLSGVALGPLSAGVPAAVNSARAAVGAALSTAGGGLVAANAAFAGSSDATGATAALAGVGAAASVLAGASVASAYLGRAGANLGLGAA
ncbi:MAG: hypothetical protein ACYCZB_06090 [Acidiphilium sp.]